MLSVVGVELGLVLFPTAQTIRPDRLAIAAERRGFGSLFLPDHTHVPVERRTPYPGGGDLPKHYAELLDPFACLASAATVTSRIELGIGVCLVPQRDPILLAKEIATIDHLSAGRFLFGVGAGWSEEEMENHGVNPATRWRRLREGIEAIRTIWEAEGEAQYHGEFFRFTAMWQWPKPFRSPHPPIIVGGAGPHVIDRVLDYGDEWMPSPGLLRGSLAEQVAELQRRAAECGRPRIRVTMYGADPTVEALEALASAGVDRALLPVPSTPTAEVLRVLDRYVAMTSASS